MNKQLIMDFYLHLLSVSNDNLFRIRNQELYGVVRDALANELGEDSETVQRIFERMVSEDMK